MIFKDIAEYEDKDSELAKFTISQLHSKIQELESQNKELARLNIEKVDIILKATELLNKYNDKESNYYVPVQYLIDILKGEDKE